MIYLKAFCLGGLLCLVAQQLIDRTRLSPARILTGYLLGGLLLSALGLYEPLADFAGCGASVPLTGFGHLLARGTRQAVDARGFWGIFTGGLSASAGGIAAAIFFALLCSLIFRPRDK